MSEDYAKKLQSLLRKLFQFESADLDFGIYRIMNRKRDVIEKFIDKDLIASVDTEFGKISATTKESAKKELDALKTAIDKTLGSSALLPSGEFNPQFINTPIGADLAKQYKEKRAAYSAASVSDEHKAEVFNNIYQFFSRYYDNGDFMSVRRYSARQKFAVPYNGEEVMLHWANKDQYYIKTGEYFFNYAFRVGEYTVRFQIVQAETAMNNTKTENRFFILHSGEGNVTYDEKSKELVILFQYRALTEAEKAAVGTRNVQDALNEQEKSAILAAIPDVGLRAGLSREVDGKTPLGKHLATYAKRNTTDYFIHKDLSGFLTQEIDFYIKNEMFDLDDLGTDKEVPVEQYLNRVRVMKAISIKIIAFLAQIEDFQKKLFEKKKFVMSANYCMTLDRVHDSFYPEIAKNTSQIAEWNALYGIGELNGQPTLSGKKRNSVDVEFLKAHPYLVLDTKFFPQEFKDKLLGTLDNLDEATDGLMVKSENWQALNLLQERYRAQVKCVYIDPPYNTGNDEFLYKDNYQHSSWLSMIYDRIHITKNFMNEKSSFYCQVDFNEANRLRILLDSILYYQREIIWSNESASGFKGQAENWIRGHDNIFYYSYSDKPDFIKQFLELTEATKRRYDKTDPVTGEKYKEYFEDDGTVRNVFLSQSKGKPLSTVWTDIISFQTVNASREHVGFDTQKPTSLINRIIQASGVKSNDFCFDFFAGSGTTAHAILNLNRKDGGKRKYILVEMAGYFDSMMKPRIERVVYSTEWKDGQPQNTDGISHMFKYLTLEQYEDTLNNIDFMEGGTVQKTLMDMDGYMLRYMLDFETRESPCRMNATKLERPFEYTLRITKDSEMHNETVDLVETFNYLLGLKVKRVRTFAENGTSYRVVHGETLAGQATTAIWRTTSGLDLKKDKAFIEEKILADPKLKAERVFINGDFHVESALPIEPEFQRLMGA